MTVTLLSILAVVIVALAVSLSRSRRDLSMSDRWKATEYWDHERADRARWNCYFGD